MDFNLYSLSKELLHVSLVSEESIKAKIQSLQNLQVVLIDENDHLIEEALKLCFENLGIVCTITTQSFRTLRRSHDQKAHFTFLNLESCPSNISNKTLLNYLKGVDNKVFILSNPSLRGDELYEEINQHPSVPYPSSIHQFQNDLLNAMIFRMNKSGFSNQNPLFFSQFSDHETYESSALLLKAQDQLEIELAKLEVIQKDFCKASVFLGLRKLELLLRITGFLKLSYQANLLQSILVESKLTADKLIQSIVKFQDECNNLMVKAICKD